MTGDADHGSVDVRCFFPALARENFVVVVEVGADDVLAPELMFGAETSAA